MTFRLVPEVLDTVNVIPVTDAITANINTHPGNVR